MTDNMRMTRSRSAYEKSKWWTIPEPVLLKVLYYLKPKDVLNAGVTCKRWWMISQDDLLWRKMFLRDFKVEANIGLKPGAESWSSEYKRLTFNIPLVLTEVLEGHSHQVLHVSFSHNGEMFATCSKDGNVIIWNSTYPCSIKYSHNMKQFSWKYTQYSQFNRTDTLLLVSGVHFGSPHSTSGEIAVFYVDNNSSYLRCRVVNRPYDIFGTWFSDQYLISGDLHWLAHLVSTSVLWLNKANQEIDSEHVPIMNHLYKFYNRNASSIRAIVIANCPWLEDSAAQSVLPGTSTTDGDVCMTEPSTSTNDDQSQIAGNPVSHTKLKQMQNESDDRNGDAELDIPQMSLGDSYYDSSIRYLDEYRREFEEIGGAESSDDCFDDDDEQTVEDNASDDDLENSVPKYLIFSTGAKTYTPHQIGIKRIRDVTFPKKLDPGPSLKERIAQRRKEKEEQRNRPRVEPDWWNYDAVADRFDKVDKVIDLHGHIIGMALSPDHRYLYVNSRPWPKDYIISNPLEPPPIAQEIDIHVIDLMTLKRVGNMLRAHKAYTPNTECFFIFLNVSDSYVASGAEDKHAYIWDRYYGMCLAKYKHNDVVNSVAFNPRDSEMLVTTSDDYSIKVWRSKNIAKKYKIEKSSMATEFRNKNL